MTDDGMFPVVFKHVVNTLFSAAAAAVLAVWRVNAKTETRLNAMMDVSRQQHSEMLAKIEMQEEQTTHQINAFAQLIESQRRDMQEKVRVIELVLWGQDGRSGVQASSISIAGDVRRQNESLVRLSTLVELLYRETTGRTAPGMTPILRDHHGETLG